MRRRGPAPERPLGPPLAVCVCVLVCCDFQPLAARKVYLLIMINPPLPHDAHIPPIPIGLWDSRAVSSVPAQHCVLPPRLLEGDRELPVSDQVFVFV